MDGKQRRQVRRDRRRQEIYDAALELFSTRGFDAVTVDDIARAADVAKGTFFNYFPSKEHLLVEYRRSLLQFIHEYGRSLEGDSARGLFKRYFRKLARRLREEGKRYEMLFQEVIARPHLVTLDSDRSLDYRVYFRRFLEVGQQSGEISARHDLDQLAEIIRDVWTGASTSWLMERPSRSLEAKILRRVDLIFDLLDEGSSTDV